MITHFDSLFTTLQTWHLQFLELSKSPVMWKFMVFFAELALGVKMAR